MEPGSNLTDQFAGHSPISRRAFFGTIRLIAVPILGALCLGQNCAPTPGDGDNCGYCNGEGHDYDHCDGDYCDYFDYADT
jgi:hypothetical protein